MNRVVNIAGLEVVQTLQNANNDVILVQGKRTFVRVYLRPIGLGEDVYVRGRLRCSVVGDSPTQSLSVPSLDAVLLRKTDHPSLFDQRLSWSQSLNFELPPALFLDHNQEPYKQAIRCYFELEKELGAAYRDGYRLRVGVTSRNVQNTVTFKPAPALRCKAVIFRYPDVDNQTVLEPRPAEVELIRQFTESAFPVAEVDWRSVIVDATPEFRALDAVTEPDAASRRHIERLLSKLLLQTAAIRNEDVLAGQHNRTLYLAVIADPSDRYGGIAVDAPEFPAPHVVAVASVDDSGQLGAHEIAHILGRKHPGVPDIKRHGAALGQVAEEVSSPLHPLGFISSERHEQRIHLGLDTGASVPRVLHYARYFDLMTYRYPKWVSQYTYEALYQRLTEIEQDADTANDPFTARHGWAVIGQYDLVQKTGRIVHVLKTNYDAGGALRQRADAASRVKIACDTDSPADPLPIYTRHPNLDLAEAIGLFHYTAIGKTPPARIRLLVDDREADRYGDFDPRAVDREFAAIKESLAGQPLTNTAATKDQGGVVLRYSVADDSYRVSFRWKAFEPGLRRTTVVQCRRPGATLWETVAVSQGTAASVTIDPAFIDPRKGLLLSVGQQLKAELSLRIIVTVGFRSECVFETGATPGASQAGGKAGSGAGTPSLSITVAESPPPRPPAGYDTAFAPLRGDDRV